MLIVELVVGLALLLGGGEALVRGSVAVAGRFGVSPLVIGLTLVGFGTSTPELVASLQAALLGSPGIAIGNVIGSNIANILLILGLSAVILPLAIGREAFRRDGVVLIVAAGLLLAAVLTGELSRWAGAVFVLLLLAYTLYAFWSERAARSDAASAAAEVHIAGVDVVAPAKTLSLAVALGLTGGGIAAVLVGADLLVQSAIEVARMLNLSEAVVGLTLVAVGTSLPELATSIMAVARRQSDVAFGNIVGSNIFNVLGIAGVTALVKPIPVPQEIVRFDIWVMLAASALLILFAVTGWRIDRREGAFFLLAYVAYLGVQVAA